MDETLLRSDKTFDEERFTKIYEEFKKRDMILAIASGNSYPKLDQYFDYMNHDDLYFAADNGNYTVKRGEKLHKNIINYDELLGAVAYLKSLTGFSIVISDGSQTYIEWINPESKEYILNYQRNLKKIDSMDEIKGLDIVKVASHSTFSLEDSKEIALNIIDNFPYLEAVTSGDGWLDFYHVGGGKGSAIKALQEKYNVSKEETMIFGDSLNDASMADYAEYSIAMSNGDAELKNIFKYEIGSNNDQAVFDILEKFLETNSIDFMDKYKI